MPSTASTGSCCCNRAFGYEETYMDVTTCRFIATLLVWITLLFVSMPTTHAANAYKCVAEHGATYFSDKQCKGSQEQTVIGIKPAPPASPEERAHLEARQQRYQRMRDAEAEDRQERRDQRAEESARKKAKQQEICEAEKELLWKLQAQICSRDDGCKFYALKKKDEAGNTVYASEQEKKAEIYRLKKSIADNCG